jgi:hypothetical protein
VTNAETHEETSVETAYLVLANTAVNGFTYTSDGSAQSGKNKISTLYGYAIDLAFQTSEEGDLRLSDAVQRISGSTDEDTLGSGSTYTFATGTSTTAMDQVAEALRVVFIDAENKILAVAKMDASGSSERALHTYEWSIDGNNVLQTGAKVDNDKVTTLAANTPTAITAIVYLDGNYVDSSMASASGTLNLQFASSESLQPMQYSDYTKSASETAGLRIIGSTSDHAVKVGSTVKLSAQYNGTTPESGVTWSSSNSDVATVDGGTVTGKAAGDVTITATYTPQDGTQQTAQFKITVSAADDK